MTSQILNIFCHLEIVDCSTKTKLQMTENLISELITQEHHKGYYVSNITHQRSCNCLQTILVTADCQLIQAQHQSVQQTLFLYYYSSNIS